MAEWYKTISDEIRGEIEALSDAIYAHPELGFDEFNSSRLHAELLEKHGFKVQKPYLGFETGYRAEFAGSKPGPKICFMAEYDALPGFGPGEASSLEVEHLIACVGEHFGRLGTAPAAPAIYHHRPGRVQDTLGLVEETVGVPVDVHGHGQMALGEFVGRAHVQQLDGRVVREHLVKLGDGQVAIPLAGKQGEEGKSHGKEKTDHSVL